MWELSVQRYFTSSAAGVVGRKRLAANVDPNKSTPAPRARSGFIIESEWDAVLVVRDYLKDKYFDGKNCLKLVAEEHGLNWDVPNDNYDVNDPPPVVERTWTVIANYEDAILWTVNSAGKVIDGPFYPPC